MYHSEDLDSIDPAKPVNGEKMRQGVHRFWLVSGPRTRSRRLCMVEELPKEMEW